jgi:hypothetical protein
VNNIQRALLTHLIAALLILGAAFCAEAQSHAAGLEQNTRGQQSVAPAKQNTRQTAAPAKQNERTSETPSPPVRPASSPADAPDAPHYFYDFKQPDFLISHLQVEHDAEGHGHVAFERRASDETITEPFEVSEAARARIKALWDNLRFLDSDKSYQSERQYPHLGTVHLRLKQGARERDAEFNWTDNKDARALADEYRRIGDQAVLIFEISIALVNDPLNTPKLMDQLETMLKRNGLSDPQQLLPLLNDLSTDERIPLIARNHAGRLLKQIKK